MDNMMLVDTPDVKTGMLYGKHCTLFSVNAARDKISLRSDIAEEWIQLVKFHEGEFEDYIIEEYISVFDNPEFAIIRDYLNLYFMPIPTLNLYEFFKVMIDGKSLNLNASQKAIHVDFMSKLSLWPRDKHDEDDMFKSSHAARILMMPEQKLRAMAAKGIIKSTKSQGDTGHYRFKREWIMEYLESNPA